MFFKTKKLLSLTILFSTLFLPVVVFALEQDYPTILGLSLNNNSSFPEYAKYFFNLGIGLAGFLAVLVIVFGAVYWLISFGRGSYENEGKEWVKSGLLGMLLILSSYIIASTINPDLVVFKLGDLPIISSLFNSSSSPYGNATVLTYQEIPIGKLTENLLTKKIICYDFDENGDPLTADIKIDTGETIKGPTLLENDRINCITKLGQAIERKSKITDLVSKKIIELMNQCACSESLGCVQDGTCNSNTFDTDNPGNCSNFINCPDRNCKCSSSDPCKVCTDETRKQFEHGPITIGKGFVYPDFFGYFPGADPEGITELYDCMAKTDIGKQRNYLGLDEFRTQIPSGLVWPNIETPKKINKKDFGIIDIEKFKKLRLVDQITYLKEKIEQMRNAVNEDNVILKGAEDQLGRCYFAKPYVEFTKIYEQAKKEDLVILPAKYSTPQEPEVDFSNYCMGYEYQNSDCYHTCENICPTFEEAATNCYRNCTTDECDPDDDEYEQCLVDQKECIDTCNNDRFCLFTDGSFSDFKGCLKSCKKGCEDSCSTNYQTCSKAMSACTGCLGGSTTSTTDSVIESVVGFNITNKECYNNCSSLCPAPSTTGAGCADICSYGPEASHCSTYINFDAQMACLINSNNCNTICDSNPYFYSLGCAQGYTDITTYTKTSGCPTLNTTCEEMCGDPATACNTIADPIDKSMCLWDIDNCVSKCDTAIDVIEHFGEWSCAPGNPIVFNPLNNMNTCYSTCKSGCSGDCSSSTANLNDTTWAACENCLTATVGISIGDYHFGSVSSLDSLTTSSGELSCDPIAENFCSQGYQDCKEQCKNDSKCLIDNREECLFNADSIQKCAGNPIYDKGNFENCADKSFLCQYGSDQYSAYADSFKDSYAKKNKNLSSSDAFENPNNLICPECYEKIPVANPTSGNPNNVLDVTCSKLNPVAVKGPSCSDCPTCPCSEVQDIKELYDVPDTCNGNPAGSSGSLTDDATEKNYYRVVAPDCQKIIYNDDPLTFYCKGFWWDDVKEKNQEPLGNEMTCPKNKEIPIGKTVDDAEFWAEETVDKYLNRFILTTNNLIEHLKKIGAETGYCQCNSECSPGGDRVCRAACDVAYRPIMVPSTNPLTGLQEMIQALDANSNLPLSKCFCDPKPCANNPCQKMINMLQGLCPSENACPKNTTFYGTGDFYGKINKQLELIVDFEQVGRTDILKELVYSRESMSSCSLFQRNPETSVRLLSCKRVFDNLIPPIQSSAQKIIYNGKEYNDYCYGKELGKIELKLSPTENLADNWFCCENQPK